MAVSIRGAGMSHATLYLPSLPREQFYPMYYVTKPGEVSGRPIYAAWVGVNYSLPLGVRYKTAIKSVGLGYWWRLRWRIPDAILKHHGMVTYQSPCQSI